MNSYIVSIPKFPDGNFKKNKKSKKIELMCIPLLQNLQGVDILRTRQRTG